MTKKSLDDGDIVQVLNPEFPKRGSKYMYKVRGAGGGDCMKIDPFGQEFEVPPKHASVIAGWNDEACSNLFYCTIKNNYSNPIFTYYRKN